MPSLLHVVSLRSAAGVEAHFAEFVRTAAARHPGWEHGWLNPSDAMHPLLAAPLSGQLKFSCRAKYAGRLKLPATPRWLRARHCRKLIERTDTRVTIVWNRTTRLQFLLDAIGAGRVIHWEHGRAWHDGRERERRSYLDRIPLVIANSLAAKRVLELRWGYAGRVEVCRNALRPSLMPEAPRAKAFPSGRRLRLGVAARLVPVKGVALVLHALKTLRAEGIDAELEIAGDGTDRQPLESLARALGISAVTHFRGEIGDMAPFYERIDCLLHVPLTEAFGLVGIEAAARGCPVIAAAVDGLPEAVADGLSGYCLEPSLPLSDYAALGSGSHDVPSRVFDPAHDALAPPRLVDPRDIGRAVVRLFAAPAEFEAMSRAASRRVVEEFRFEPHVDAVMALVDAFAASAAA